MLTRPLEVDFPVTLRNGIIRVQSEAWLVEGSNVIHAPYVIQVSAAPGVAVSSNDGRP